MRNNKISKYVKCLKSQYNLIHSPEIIPIASRLLKGDCIYYPNFIFRRKDYTYFEKLKDELNQMMIWSKHKKHENPYTSETYCNIIDEIKLKYENDFSCEIDIIETRLNYYENGNDWKPYHQDRNAFSSECGNITIGVSFGHPRKLSFRYLQDENIVFEFPQNNGDLFAFSDETNKLFEHSVPRNSCKIGDRISIIIWGTKT